MSQISLKSISGITSITTSVGVDNQLTVHTNDTTERIKITSSGLNVSGVVTATSFVGSGANLTGIDATKIITGNTQVQTIDTGSDGHVKVTTEGSERLRITSAGKFGIGNADPKQPVSISNGRVSIDVNNDYYGVWADGSTTGENHISVGRWYNTGGGLKSGYSQYGINNLVLTNNHATASHCLVIQPNGQKVAIGTHLTDGLVHIGQLTAGSVSADADADELVLESSGNTGMSILSPGTGESSIYFGNPGTNGQKDGWIKYYHETHSTTANRRNLIFATGGNTERLRINSSGTVRIKRAVSTSLGNDSIFLAIGDTENGTNVNRMIGFGYNSNFGTSVYPASMGYTESDNSGNTKGALTFNTRNTTGATDVPVERLRITSEGQIQTKSLSGSYYPIASVRDGSTSARAATSAWEIKKTLGPAARTGYYYLKDTTGTVAQWWCDMDTDGGGWILIAHVGEGSMSSQSTSGDHWWDATNRGGFNSIGSGYYKGGGYWRGSGGAWAENTCGQLMWDVRTHQEYYDNYANAKVVFNWGTDQAIPTGNSGYSNIPNAGNRKLNEWCYEVCGAPGFNPAQYNQNTRNNTINGGNHFTEHMVMTWCFRGTGGGGDDGDSGPYWMIGSHHDGLHQHYEEGLSGSDGVYGDGGYYVVSNEDSGWGGGGDNDGYPRIGRHTDTGTCNIWMR